MNIDKQYAAATRIEQSTEQALPNLYLEAISIPGILSSSASDGEDFRSSENAMAGSGGGLNSIYLISENGTGVFVSVSDILEDFDADNDDNWSVEIPIVSGSWNTGGTITFADETALYDNTGSSQTKARIPIIRDNGGDPITIAVYGTYHEGIRCVNGESVVEFYKI